MYKTVVTQLRKIFWKDKYYSVLLSIVLTFENFDCDIYEILKASSEVENTIIIKIAAPIFDSNTV